jgi:hypothetical protein
MNRKAYWGVLALVFMALAFLPGCSSSPQSPPPAQVVTVSADSGYGQYAYVGMPYATAFTATVTVNGSPVAGQTVTFTAPTTNGASGTFADGNNYTIATTDSNGMATSSTFNAMNMLVNPFTANMNVGTYLVIASTQGTNSTATFSLSNTTTPAAIAATGGTPQSQTVSMAFGTALAATVTDGSGNPVVGIPVTFTAPATGASGYFSESNSGTETIMTGSNGVATAGTFNANGTAGTYTVTATVPGVATGADFDLTNNAAAGALHKLSVYPKLDELEAMNNGLVRSGSRP